MKINETTPCFKLAGSRFIYAPKGLMYTRKWLEQKWISGSLQTAPTTNLTLL
ncbi:hypothetical protein HB852_07520 [Listeria grandensis]|nr:hypothetical protein [Listeria grandensis]